MKPACLLLVVGMASAPPSLWADFPPSFNGASLAPPTLSLRESIADGSLLTAPSDRKEPFRRQALMGPRTGTLERGVPGRMPIIEPDPNTDFRMLVQTPDASFDYKMLMRETSKAGKVRR